MRRSDMVCKFVPLCLLALVPQTALAQVPDSSDPANPPPAFAPLPSGGPQAVPAIQNRKHRLRFELALGPALLPSDAYSKEVGGALQLTYHFNDLLAWEIAHAHAYWDYRSGLRAQLEDNFGYVPQRFPVLRYALDSNLVVTPIYAKLALLNGKLLYLNLFGLVGVGAGLVIGGEPEPGSTDPGRGLHVAVLGNVGIGIRAWLTRSISLRYEIRQYVSFDTATKEVSPPFYMSLVAGFALGGVK